MMSDFSVAERLSVCIKVNRQAQVKKWFIRSLLFY